MADGIGDLTAQISESMEKEDKGRVAVIPFRDLDGSPSLLGAYLAEELITGLVAKGSFDVVERRYIDDLLTEMKLGETGLIDRETAQEVGRLSGADTIVTGTMTELHSFVSVNCRVIDTDSGSIFTAANVKIVKDENLRMLISPKDTKSAEEKQRRNAKTTSSAESTPHGDAIPSFETESYRLIVESANRSHNIVSLVVTVYNRTGDTLNFELRRWHLIAEDGERWEPPFTEYGTYETDTARFVISAVQIPPGGRRKTRMRFTGKSPGSVKKFAMIATEARPKNGREIVVYDLAVE